MTRLAALPFALLLIRAAPARTQTVTDLDRFRLWNECRPMRLVVEGLDEDAADIGLKEEAISVAARSRLRAARLYTEELGNYLYINVNVVGASRAYGISVEYNKLLIDIASGELGSATTWNRGSTGTSGNANFILSSVSRHTDSFIDEYLRVNEDACAR